MLKPTDRLLSQMVTALIQAAAGAAKGPLNGAYVGLGTAVVDNGQLTVLSNITEATYDGYVRVSVGAWGAVYKDGSGNWFSDAGLTYFAPNGSTTPNLITVVFLADSLGGGNLLAYEPLQVPVALAGPQTALPYLARLRMNPANAIGQGETWT